jgi:hypothetical protein
LRDVDVVQSTGNFELDNGPVSAIGSAVYSPTIMLPWEIAAPLWKVSSLDFRISRGDGVLVELFNEFVTERISNLKSTPGDRLPQPRNPLHPSSSR